MQNPALVHLCGGLILSCLYFTVFVFTVKDMLIPTRFRNLFALSLGLLFLLNALLFFFYAAHVKPWGHPALEILVLGVAASPAVLYFVLGARNHFTFSFIEVNVPNSPNSRFDKLKEEFLSVASHELRTPLSVINGFAEILVREKLGPLNDEQKRRVRKILMQGQRLNRIIDELLDLSRIRRGKIECRKDIFDLIPVLKACLDDHQIVCEQQKIELSDEVPDILPDVVGDLERVTQIVVNLLNNAIKYTEPGGRVALSASYDKVTRAVKVLVRDTGIGIDKEDQVHVFREFFRAQHRHAKRYSGSGLGLTIVKQLVEAQGGTVGVHSDGLGRGSTFYFTLPTAKDSKVPLAVSVPAA